MESHHRPTAQRVRRTARPLALRPAIAGRLLALPLAALILLALPAAARAESVAQQVSGHVELGRGAPPVWAPLVGGSPLSAGDRIRTGPDGRVEIATDAGTLRVYENSLLTLPAARGTTDRVELEAGRSLFDVLRRAGRDFEVHTPTVVVSVKGTRFGVETDVAAGVVSVYRGVVGVRSTQAEAMVETLVREGFLAAGGGDRPIDLDVVSGGDPWAAWEALQSGGTSGAGALREAPETELERAKASLRRSTDEEVLKRAAERRPEIAERLRQRAAESKTATRTERDGAGAPEEGKPTNDASPVPAAPAALDDFAPTEGGDDRKGSDTSGRELLDSTRDRGARDDLGLGADDGDGKGLGESLDGIRIEDVRELDGTMDSRLDSPPSPTDPQREVLDMRRSSESLGQLDQLVDLDGLSGGTIELSTDRLDDYDPTQLLMLMNAMQEMEQAAGSVVSPWTETEVERYLENRLIEQGMDPTRAGMMVDRLIQGSSIVP